MKTKICLFVGIIFFVATNINNAQEVISINADSMIYSKGTNNMYFKMSEKKEQESLKKYSKELKEKLRRIKKHNKRKYYNLLRGYSYYNMKGFYNGDDNAISFFNSKIKEDKVQQMKNNLNIEVEALSIDYEEASSGEKGKIRKEIIEKISQLFDLKEKRRKAELVRLEKEISSLKRSLEIRRKKKSEIVERRVAEILKEDNYLDW